MRVGDAVTYTSWAGPVYPAVVTRVGPEGFVDLDVDIGCKTLWPLAAVRIARISPAGAAQGAGAAIEATQASVLS